MISSDLAICLCTNRLKQLMVICNYSWGYPERPEKPVKIGRCFLPTIDDYSHPCFWFAWISEPPTEKTPASNINSAWKSGYLSHNKMPSSEAKCVHKKKRAAIAAKSAAKSDLRHFWMNISRPLFFTFCYGIHHCNFINPCGANMSESSILLRWCYRC